MLINQFVFRASPIETDTFCFFKQEKMISNKNSKRHFFIIEEIPVMLPDELRDKKQEDEFLKKNKDSLPEKITKQGKPWHL